MYKVKITFENHIITAHVGMAGPHGEIDSLEILSVIPDPNLDSEGYSNLCKSIQERKSGWNSYTWLEKAERAIENAAYAQHRQAYSQPWGEIDLDGRGWDT